MNLRHTWNHVLRDREGDEGAAGDGKPAGDNLFGAGDGDEGGGEQGRAGGHPAEGEGNADGGTPQGEGEGAGEGERPAYIPEKFWDAEEGKPRLEAWSKAYNDTAAALTKAQQGAAIDKTVPKAADDYLKTWATPEGEDGGLKAKVGDIPADDPALVAFAKMAHANGYSQDRFQKSAAMFLESIAEFLPAKTDLDEERAKLGGGDKAKAAVGAAESWLASLGPRPDDQETGRRSPLSESEVAALQALGRSADGINAVLKLRELSGEAPIPANAPAEGADGVLTPDECQALMGKTDEKGRVLYNLNGPEGDRWRAKVDKEFERTFGTGRGNYSGRVMPRGMDGNA